jgi:hypothetical protein
MMKNVGLKTSPRASTWSVQPLYKMKKLLHRLLLQAAHGLYSIYIYDEKSWSRDFPCSLYMPCTAYIYDRNLVPRLPMEPLDCLFSLYIWWKKLVPRFHLEPLHGVYSLYILWKKLSHSLLLEALNVLYSLNIWWEKLLPRLPHWTSTWPVQTIYMMKKVAPETFPSLYMSCTAYIYGEKVGPETFPRASTWRVLPIYIYIYDEKSCSRNFPYRLYKWWKNLVPRL